MSDVDAPRSPLEHVSHDGPTPEPEPPVPAPHPLGLAVSAMGLVAGDVLIVRADGAPPPVPAGVQVWMLGEERLLRLSPEALYRLGWVRRKA